MSESRITLIRHAAPRVSTDERIRGHHFGDWVARYEASDIVPPPQPLPHFPKVYCSTLLRAQQTAALLSDHVVADSRLVEAPVPALSLAPLRGKARHFVNLARLLWLLGLHREVESAAKAKTRAEHVADWLAARAGEEGEVVVVAHGFINHLIGKALQRRGWQAASDQTSSHHLGQTEFCLTR